MKYLRRKFDLQDFFNFFLASALPPLLYPRNGRGWDIDASETRSREAGRLFTAHATVGDAVEGKSWLALTLIDCDTLEAIVVSLAALSRRCQSSAAFNLRASVGIASSFSL